MNFKYAPFLEQEWEDIESKIVGEVKSFFNPCKIILPSMIEKRRGCIIPVSSGLSKRPGQGFIVHSAAKAALNMLTISLSQEVSKYGIRVNTIAPGLTETDATAFHPEEMKKKSSPGKPDEKNRYAGRSCRRHASFSERLCTLYIQQLSSGRWRQHNSISSPLAWEHLSKHRSTVH